MNVAEYLKPHAIGRKLIEHFIDRKKDFDDEDRFYQTLYEATIDVCAITELKHGVREGFKGYFLKELFIGYCPTIGGTSPIYVIQSKESDKIVCNNSCIYEGDYTWITPEAYDRNVGYGVEWFQVTKQKLLDNIKGLEEAKYDTLQLKEIV